MASTSTMRQRPGRWAIIVAVAACVLVGVLMLREPIGRWIFPDAALAGLIAQAEQALAGGDLDTAAARFDAALARAPDHPRVVDGLAATRERSLADAERAIAEGDAVRVASALARAARLGAPGERIDALRQSMLAQAEPSLEVVLQRATALEAADPSAALALYRQVLRRAPGNALALSGRSRLLSTQLARAAQAMDAGDLARAAALVDDVRAIDPAHLQLPELEARLGAAGVRLPDAATAAAAADSAEAIRWRGLADEAIGRGAFDDARRAIGEARRLSPQAPDLATLEQRLERAEAAQSGAR